MTSDNAFVPEIALPEPRDRKVTLSHRAEYALTIMLAGFFRLVGVDAASAIGGGVARAVGPLIWVVSNRAKRNLQIAFPEWPAPKVREAISDVWENLGRVTAEFAHLARFDPDAADSRVEINGRERLEEIAKCNRPAIFVSGHFANWEIMSIALHAIGIDYGVVYRAANNPLIDALIIRERANVMTRRQIPKGKRGGRDMIEAIKAGASLAMLVDQKLTTGGFPAPFFGKPAMTAPAAARLALKYSAPVIPIEIERLKGARFRVTAHPAMRFAPSGDSSADTKALTALINLEIEAMIRARPGQWLWLHRRWEKEAYQ